MFRNCTQKCLLAKISLLVIQEVSGSNLSLEAGYPHQGFPCFLTPFTSFPIYHPHIMLPLNTIYSMHLKNDDKPTINKLVLHVVHTLA